MPDNSGSLHETGLPAEVVDTHRAIASLMEELEAVDWYNQRVHATSDPELQAILAHNRDEEKEHAMMVLEWLRRRDPVLDGHMRTYLFTTGAITEIEHEAEQATGGAGETGAAGGTGSGGDLGIGNQRGEPPR
jgi:ferritin-like protein